MTNFNPAATLDMLARHDVAYVLIGGYAALLQGSGMATVDIDIVPEKTATNLANLAAALIDLGSRIRARVQLTIRPNRSKLTAQCRAFRDRDA